MNKPPRWHKDAPAPKRPARPARPLWATAATPADRYDADPRDPNSVHASPIFDRYTPCPAAPAKRKDKRRAAYNESPNSGLLRMINRKRELMGDDYEDDY